MARKSPTQQTATDLECVTSLFRQLGSVVGGPSAIADIANLSGAKLASVKAFQRLGFITQLEDGRLFMPRCAA